MAALIPESRQASESPHPTGHSSTAGSAPRSSKVRTTCKAQKVRCDEHSAGGPCKNCCVGKRNYVVDPMEKESGPKKICRRLSSSSASYFSAHTIIDTCANAAEGYDGLAIAYSNDSDHSRPSSPPESIDDDDVEMGTALYQAISQRRSRLLSFMDPLDQSVTESKTSLGARCASKSCSNSLHICHRCLALPSFVQQPPSTMSEAGLKYLHDQGALFVPQSELRNELLQCHMQYVHGYLPLLEPRDFLRVLDEEDKTLEPVSLLLFQAIMFTGSAFVDLKHLKLAGFKNRKVAREVLYQRTKLLFEYNYEENQLSRVQAVILLTYWNDMPNTEKDTWYWMGVSLSLAKAIGLHRNPENLGVNISERRLRKRIWWSCFMRDQLIALGMRKLPRISIDDFDVTMLVLEDFNIVREAFGAAEVLDPVGLLQNSQDQVQIARMCIAQAKLCLFIGPILSTQYSSRGITRSMRLLPKTTNWQSVEIFSCERELQKWLEDLPDETRQPKRARAHVEDAEQVTYLHYSLLKMTFLAIVITLHRPQAFSIALETTDVAPDLQVVSRNKVMAAAAELSDIAHDIQEQNLSGFLPTSGVTVLVPAMVVHLASTKFCDTVTRSNSLRQFYQDVNVLRRLCEMYISADVAISYLKAAVLNAQLPIAKLSPSLLASAEIPQSLSHVETSSSNNRSKSPNLKEIAHTVVSNITLSSNESCMLLNLSVSPPLTPSTTVQSHATTIPASDWNAVLGQASEDRRSSDFDYWIDFDRTADAFPQDMMIGLATSETADPVFGDVDSNEDQEWILGIFDVDGLGGSLSMEVEG